MRYLGYALAIIYTIFFSSGLFAQKISLFNSEEKILYNAKIFTSNTMQPFAEAVAISGNKIIAVGNFETIKKSVSKNAVLIDMNGGNILPGFIDSHSHALDGGYGLTRANVFDSILTPDQLSKFAIEVKKNGTGMIGDFLVVDGLSITTWSHIDELKKIFNDGVYTHQPVLLRGSDGHTEWGNNQVLQKAGLNKNFIEQLSPTQKMYYGVDNDGVPNGFVADSGFYKIDAILPEEVIDWEKAGIKALEYNNSLGITAWLDPATGSINDKKNDYLDEYKNLSQKNKLTAHIAAVVVADANAVPKAQIDKLQSLQKKYNIVNNLSVLGFKIFADGVIEYPTQTAALSTPYLNSGGKGSLMVDPIKFAQFATLADKMGLLVHVHAIGDLATTEVLNGFEIMRKANGNSGIPHTITHLQFVQPNDFLRFNQLGVLASMQLLWALADATTIDIVKPYIAPELYKWQYPARSLLQAGAIICGASDWNVSSANPFEAIYKAETRNGEMGVLDSSQCMPRMAMLFAYTINASKALRMQNNIGSIEPGKYADMIFIDRDILTVSAEEMAHTKVNWTMFEGKIVYTIKSMD